MKSARFTFNGAVHARFWCPGCDDLHQVTDQWTISPEGEPLTLHPSVLVRRGRIPTGTIPEERCHSFVVEDEIRFLDDSTHELAGQTVGLPELPEVWVRDAADHDDNAS